MRLDLNKMILAIFILAILGVGISVSFIIAAWGFLTKAVIETQPSPALQVDLLERPATEPHCPGEYVNYGVVIKPLRWPVAARLVVTLYNLNEGNTAVPQVLGDERVVVYTSPARVTAIDRYFVPTHSPRSGKPITPGDYEIRFAAVVEGASPSVASLPFVIPPNCVKP